MKAAHRSFGRTSPAATAVMSPEEGLRRLRDGQVSAGTLLATGNLRSYGDSCLNTAGALIDMRTMDRIISVDEVGGTVEAEAGVGLPALIAAGAPHRLLPPVVPGTQFVTLGGMIANDIHGKNHHRRGSFGSHVLSLKLLRSDGDIHHCSRTENAELFAATVGGMGLTGVILSATVRLMRVNSLDIAETSIPFGSLEEYFDLAEAADEHNEYAVAWVDQLATGRHTGRGVLITGNHAENGSTQARRSTSRLAVPFQPPINLLNRPFLKVFNLAYRMARTRRGARQTSYTGFFFPLDGVANWNRLYGPAGLHQHQSVVPFDRARTAIPAMFRAAEQAGQGSFLTVLKRFGASVSPGLISFPRPGYTLTLDFPNRGEPTRQLLAQLDRIAVEAGGAVNPYKDARMSVDTFAASFPRWRQLELLRDPAFVSDFWRRTALSLPGTTSARPPPLSTADFKVTAS